MIRLVVSDPTSEPQIFSFASDTVSIGRSPDNDICLNDIRVSKHHGSITTTDSGHVYQDLGSTNGSLVVVAGQTQGVCLQENTLPDPVAIAGGDTVRIGTYSIELQQHEEVMRSRDDDQGLTVVVSRPLKDMGEAEANLLTQDPKVGRLILRLMRESGNAYDNPEKLNILVTDTLFEAFEMATHLVLATRNLDSSLLQPLVAMDRAGTQPRIALSQTIINQVLKEGVALLFSDDKSDMAGVRSIKQARIETAICAPLIGRAGSFGVIQLDIRRPADGMFTSRDVEVLALIANHLGLALDNARLSQQQRRAFESTIHALVHSLSLKDPETAAHSERVQMIALMLGREWGLDPIELEALGVAAILHDTGKQAIADEILFKPGQLSQDEIAEVSRHAAHTQGILDKIVFPDHLRHVPRIAAYHHEKMNGSGPYQISGDQIPIPTRMIAVADAFDALHSARSYKVAKPLDEVLSVLERGRDTDWDGDIIDIMMRIAPQVQQTVYRVSSSIPLPGIPLDSFEDRGKPRVA
jgi:pSer/pThr/pTyr-binding forkhead associated (FHA) protein